MNSIGSVPGEKINAVKSFQFQFCYCYSFHQAGTSYAHASGSSLISSIDSNDQGIPSEELTFSEVEERWKGTSIGEARVWVSQFIEVGVKQSHQWFRPLRWIVTEESGHEGDGVSWGPVPEDLFPGQRLDLWESIFGVIFVHCQNLVTGWCPQDFDDLDELVNTTLSWENWLSKHDFCDNATT